MIQVLATAVASACQQHDPVRAARAEYARRMDEIENAAAVCVAHVIRRAVVRDEVDLEGAVDETQEDKKGDEDTAQDEEKSGEPNEDEDDDIDEYASM